MDLKRLTNILMTVGASLLVGSLFWWGSFYSGVVRFFGGKSLLDAFSCLYESAGACGMAMGFAQMQGSTPYSPIFFWIGAAGLTLGVLIRVSMTDPRTAAPARNAAGSQSTVSTATSRLAAQWMIQSAYVRTVVLISIAQFVVLCLALSTLPVGELVRTGVVHALNFPYIILFSLLQVVGSVMLLWGRRSALVSFATAALMHALMIVAGFFELSFASILFNGYTILLPNNWIVLRFVMFALIPVWLLFAFVCAARQLRNVQPAPAAMRPAPSA